MVVSLALPLALLAAACGSRAPSTDTTADAPNPSPPTTAASSTTSTTSQPEGRSGSFRAESGGGDVVLVEVTVGETTTGDQASGGGKTLSALCGIGGMAGTKASATKVRMEFTLESSVSNKMWIKLLTSDRHGELFASNWQDGWSCRSGASVVIGSYFDLQPGKTSTLEGWWVKSGAVTSSDPTGERTSMLITPLVEWGANQKQSDRYFGMSGRELFRCGAQTMLITGSGCK